MREYIVFVSKEHYNPLGIVRTLGEAGIRPIVVAVKGDLKFVGQSRYVKKKFYVDTPEEGLELIISKYAVSKSDKSYILTGDDVTVSLLDNNFERLKDYFYFYNAGQNGRINYYMNKDVMNSLVSKYGINTIRTWKINVNDIPNDIEYPVMTKAINSIGKEWKNIVYICKDKNELEVVCKKIKSESILIQRYIEKIDEISVDAFSINKGKDVFTVMQANQVYCLEDKYSPYWNIKNFDNPEMQKKINDVIAEIGLEGIFEFEFLVDKDGIWWFLEINFRNTALGYATTVARMPQVVFWCESMEKGFIDEKRYCKKVPKGFTAMAECFDYDARVMIGKINKKEWKKQYKEAECKLYRGKNDFLPFFIFMIHKLFRNF